METGKTSKKGGVARFEVVCMEIVQRLRAGAGMPWRLEAVAQEKSNCAKPCGEQSPEKAIKKRVGKKGTVIKGVLSSFAMIFARDRLEHSNPEDP